jgi:hypothetical protein
MRQYIRIFMAVLVILIVSCQSAPVSDDQQLPSPVVSTAQATIQATAQTTEEVIEVTNTPQPKEKVINPLTGLKVNDPQILNRKPVMVKVSNFPRNGRPHAGLSFADIVFDYDITNGQNRFLALYYGQDCPKIGWWMRSSCRCIAEYWHTVALIMIRI